MKGICVHIPEDDDGDEVLEGCSWGFRGDVDTMFTEDSEGVRVAAGVASVVASDVAAGVAAGVTVDVAVDVADRPFVRAVELGNTV